MYALRAGAIVCRQLVMESAPDPMPAARAVGTLLAPVVACLRGDDNAVGILLDGACEEGTVAAAVRAPRAAVMSLARPLPTAVVEAGLGSDGGGLAAGKPSPSLDCPI